jgi:hypothetical protein
LKLIKAFCCLLLMLSSNHLLADDGRVSVKCPCAAQQNNQTSASLKFSLIFDAYLEQSGPLEIQLAISDSLGFESWTVLSESSSDTVAYSESPVEIELDVPLFAMSKVREGFLGLVVKSNDGVVDIVLLNELKIEFIDHQGVFWDSSDRFMFLSKPSVVFSEDKVRITISQALSTKYRSSTETLDLQIRVSNSELNYYLKGSISESVNFASDGTITIDYEVPLDRPLDSHVDINPEHTEVWLSLGINGEWLLRYFLDSLDDSKFASPYFSLSDVNPATDSNGDGLSDYVSYLLGEDFQFSRNGSPTNIEVGFTYGNRANEEFGSSLQARLDHVISVTNLAFRESGVRLAISQTDLVFVGEDESIRSDQASLEKMQEKDGPFLDLIAKFTRRPDVIIHLSTSRFQFASESSGFAVIGGRRRNGVFGPADGFERGSNVAIVYLDLDDLTLAHELGHVLGLGHSRKQTESIGNSTFPWSVGHGIESDFATIMAYPTVFDVESFVGYFSSPALTCSTPSGACGISSEDILRGADSVKTLNITGWQVSAYSNGFPPHIAYDGPEDIFQTTVSEENLKGLFRAFDSEDGEMSHAIEIELAQLEASEYQKSFSLRVVAVDSDSNSASLQLNLHLLSDYDGDGIADTDDFDDDNDGLADTFENELGLNSLNADSDGDGAKDGEDAFPMNPSESVDTDVDGIGNNADLDDDGDGFTDEEELADGTDPLSRFSCRSGCFSFDVDESLEAQPLTDGLLVIRHLFGFSGDSLTSGAVSGGASRGSSEAIAGYLTDADSQLDIDGDGESKPLTDGLLLIRYLFGFSGDSLIFGAIGTGASRDTAETVEAYIKERVPAE